MHPPTSWQAALPALATHPTPLKLQALCTAAAITLVALACLWPGRTATATAVVGRTSGPHKCPSPSSH